MFSRHKWVKFLKVVVTAHWWGTQFPSQDSEYFLLVKLTLFLPTCSLNWQNIWNKNCKNIYISPKINFFFFLQLKNKPNCFLHYKMKEISFTWEIYGCKGQSRIFSSLTPQICISSVLLPSQNNTNHLEHFSFPRSVIEAFQGPQLCYWTSS